MVRGSLFSSSTIGFCSSVATNFSSVSPVLVSLSDMISFFIVVGFFLLGFSRSLPRLFVGADESKAFLKIVDDNDDDLSLLPKTVVDFCTVGFFFKAAKMSKVMGSFFLTFFTS